MLADTATCRQTRQTDSSQTQSEGSFSQQQELPVLFSADVEECCLTEGVCMCGVETKLGRLVNKPLGRYLKTHTHTHRGQTDGSLGETTTQTADPDILKGGE